MTLIICLVQELRLPGTHEGCLHEGGIEIHLLLHHQVLLYGVLLLFQVPGRMGDCSPLGDLTEQLSRTLLEDALQGG